MKAICGPNQLRRDTNVVTLLANAAFEHKGNPKCLTNNTRILVALRKLKGVRAGRHL